jgi:hypothetical protein
MRASALIIRRFLERAIDDIRNFLNHERENEKARNEASELYKSMVANKTPQEVQGHRSPELTPQQYAAIEWKTAGGKPITDEQREKILAGVLPGQPIGDKGYASLGLALRGGWRESTRQAATWLRKGGETVAADGIEFALEELGEASDAVVQSEHRDATRTAAEYLLRILSNCLPDEPTDPTNTIPGQPKSDVKTASNADTQASHSTGLAETNQQELVEMERNTPALDTGSINWIAARKKNQKKLGYPTNTLATYRLKSSGGRQLSPYFGVDKDGRRWRRQPDKTEESTVYYFANDIEKYQPKASN